MQNFTRKLLIASMALMSACSSHRGVHTSVPDMDSLVSLQSMYNSRGSSAISVGSSTGKMREAALQEIALSLGAQAALAHRAKTINKQLVTQARTLDKVFDFQAIVMEHNILPPVLLEGRNTLNMADTQTLRISNRTYKVYKQARFITTAPNWREYLWMDYKKPDPPNVSLLPKTSEERKVWQYYITKGWKNGEEQANTILEDRIARIKEDFEGMILYRKLLAMNMVSPPYVSNLDLGVTGNASEMHIDDRVLRITALPQLNINSKEWRAAVAQDPEALKKFGALEEKIRDAKIVITDKAWQPIITPVG